MASYVTGRDHACRSRAVRVAVGQRGGRVVTVSYVLRSPDTERFLVRQNYLEGWTWTRDQDRAHGSTIERWRRIWPRCGDSTSWTSRSAADASPARIYPFRSAGQEEAGSTELNRRTCTALDGSIGEAHEARFHEGPCR